MFSPSDKPFIGLYGLTCRLIAWAQVQEPLSGLSPWAKHLTPDCSHVASPAIGISRKEKYKRKNKALPWTLLPIQALVISRPAYCNFLLSGLPASCQTSSRAHPKMLLLDLFLTSENALLLHLCSGLYTGCQHHQDTAYPAADALTPLSCIKNSIQELDILTTVGTHLWKQCSGTVWWYPVLVYLIRRILLLFDINENKNVIFNWKLYFYKVNRRQLAQCWKGVGLHICNFTI